MFTVSLSSKYSVEKFNIQPIDHFNSSNHIEMSHPSTSYTAEKLYEEAYNIQYNWDNILPLDVLEFHTLVSKQTNAPVNLQMGTVLPFVASCMGPKTHGHFLTTLSCLNLFWIIVATSGAGKSQSCQRFISEPLEYILSNARVKIEDFEISKFTRAGEFIILSNIYIVCNLFYKCQKMENSIIS